MASSEEIFDEYVSKTYETNVNKNKIENGFSFP